MFFNTIVTNPSDKEIRIGFLGKGITTIGPKGFVEVPYEVMTACRNPQQKRALEEALMEGIVKISYNTDIPMQTGAKKDIPAPKAEKVEVPVKEEKPEIKTPEVKQDEILSESAKAKLKEADEGTGIVEGTIEEVIPEAITIGADVDDDGNPILPPEPETVTLEDDGSLSSDADAPEGLEPTKPEPAKEAPKKTAAKKATAKKTEAKKAPAKKKAKKVS